MEKKALPMGWAEPELRREWVAAAARQRDVEGLLEGLVFYARTHRKLKPRSAADYAEVFADLLTYLWFDLGRAGLDWKEGDLRRWFADLEERGPHRLAPGRERRPLGPGALRRWRAALGLGLDFLAWAGFPAPARLPRPEPVVERRARVASEAEVAALLAAARAPDHPAGALDRLLLHLLAYEGFTLQQAAWARASDYDPAGAQLRRRAGPHAPLPFAPLEPETRTALDDWLARRRAAGLAGGELLLRLRGGGPFTPVGLRTRLRALALRAGVRPERLARGLRNRAALLLYRRGGEDARAVATRLGLAVPPDVLRRTGLETG